MNLAQALVHVIVLSAVSVLVYYLLSPLEWPTTLEITTIATQITTTGTTTTATTTTTTASTTSTATTTTPTTTATTTPPTSTATTTPPTTTPTTNHHQQKQQPCQTANQIYSSVYCNGESYKGRICYFENLFYTPHLDEFIFIHHPCSTYVGFPQDSLNPGLLELSAVIDYDGNGFNLLDVEFDKVKECFGYTDDDGNKNYRNESDNRENNSNDNREETTTHTNHTSNNDTTNNTNYSPNNNTNYSPNNNNNYSPNYNTQKPYQQQRYNQQQQH